MKKKQDRELARGPVTALDRKGRLAFELTSLRDDLEVTLHQIDHLVQALEQLLEGKKSPTKDVDDLWASLRRAKSKFNQLYQEFGEIEGFLDFETKKVEE